jgi:phosphomevalonate kinase
MGNESSVPIEPESQTSLLNDSRETPGVLIAGVPGAGGYDAIFCIIADDAVGLGGTFGRLVNAWANREVRVCPLLAREENSGILLEDANTLI